VKVPSANLSVRGKSEDFPEAPLAIGIASGLMERSRAKRPLPYGRIVNLPLARRWLNLPPAHWEWDESFLHRELITSARWKATGLVLE
jgi:hypothetical protein